MRTTENVSGRGCAQSIQGKCCAEVTSASPIAFGKCKKPILLFEMSCAFLPLPVSLLTLLLSTSLSQAAVTVTHVVKNGDPVPGRGAGISFLNVDVGVAPVINESNEIVFRAGSSQTGSPNSQTASGLYAKRPGFPLAVLVDTTEVSPGIPTFVVPDRPAGARFSSVTNPRLNNAGDVLFFATFGGTGGSGSGHYVVKTTGGPIKKIVDTFTTVPGQPTATFQTFLFVSTQETAAINDAGQIVYWGQFLIPPSTTANGIYGTTVSGGPSIVLADSTQTIGPVSVPIGPIGNFRDLRGTPVINSTGTVAFSGNLGPSPSFRNGIFAVPVTGGAITTVAFRGQPVPGRALTFTDTFDPSGYSFDINNLGVVVFRNNPTGSEFGTYSATPSGSTYTHARILDTLGGISIPGETVPPAEFSGNSPPAVNELNQVGHYSFVINSPTPNQQGFYATDIDGTPISLIANLSSPVPGLASPPAAFGNLLQESAAINDSGNLLFRATGTSSPGVGFRGLYFYDVCTPELVRISDSSIAPVQLGGTFSTVGGQNPSYIVAQNNARSGLANSMNNSNNVAFIARFSNLSFGVYLAEVSSGGGQLAITCPADATLECPADTSEAATGQATATGCGTITISSSDAVTSNCGSTYSIARTWTASNASNSATCIQTINVVDTAAPVLSGVPNKASAECDAIPPAPTVTAADTCEGTLPVALTETTDPGACPGTYKLIRTWTASDSCSNSVSASHSICVLDTTAPVLLGIPADVSVECDAVPPPGDPTTDDNCNESPSIAFSETRTDGSCVSEYTLTRTWTATDECLNAFSESQIVTVDDNTAPSISCPPHATLQCPANTNIAANGSATGSDNCGDVSITSSDAAIPGCGTTQTITRTWSATDACGNSSSCDQLVAVVDLVPPVLTVNTTPITVTDTNCNGTQAATLPTATATDSCGGTVSVSHNGPALFTAGVTTPVTYVASDACGNTSSANVNVTVKHNSNIRVEANKYTIGFGHHPVPAKTPLVGVNICAYDKSNGSCARQHTNQWWGIFWHDFEDIAENCGPAACATTNSSGIAMLNLPPGDYLIITPVDYDSDSDVDIYLGDVVCDLDCGELKKKHVSLLVTAFNRHYPAKCTRLTGSELLIFEPEYVLWDETEQLYPFVFETEGDWGVTATVTPPEGFEADYEELSANVASEIESVQFTITEVGSDLVPTLTKFNINHKGRNIVVDSKVDIRLTEDYARSRGFDAAELRTRNLIMAPQKKLEQPESLKADSQKDAREVNDPKE